MEELKHPLYSSWRGYRAHLSKLLTKANETIDTHHHTEEECDMTTIADLCNQFQWKDHIILKLDSQIVELIHNASLSGNKDHSINLAPGTPQDSQSGRTHLIKGTPINEDTQTPQPTSTDH